MNVKRFRVAFSFAGEKRQYVLKVASILAERFGKSQILYDEFHEPEFANADLAFNLLSHYRNDSELIVSVLCADYDQKKWCGLEWRAIFAMIKEGDTKQILLTRFDHVDGKGLHGLGGYVDLDHRTPEQAVSLILERLALNEGNPPDFYAASGESYQTTNCLVAQKTLILGELMIDITEQVVEPEVRRTAARHKFPVYQNLGKAKHVLGGVFFHARFLEPICKSLHVVFPFPTMATPSMDLEEELEKLSELTDKWKIVRPAVSRPPYCVRRTFLNPTQEEVLRVDSGTPEQLNDKELRFIEEKTKRAMQEWARMEGNPAILLADYDLGLFSKQFMDRIPGLLSETGMSDSRIVVHSGRSWLKFVKLPHAIIVSDWDEALVDYLRLDPESTSLVEEFDSNPFPRIAKAFPDLHGFVLVEKNKIRAGFWAKEGSFVKGEEILVNVESLRSQPRIGERAIVACWLCAALESERPKRILIEQAVKALKEARAVLTDRLWTDTQTQVRLNGIMNSYEGEPRTKITPLFEKFEIRSVSAPSSGTVTDGFPMRRLAVACLYHEGDTALYRNFCEAVETQSRIGKLQVESVSISPGQFQVERIRNKLRSFDIVLLFGSPKFFGSEFCLPVVQMLSAEQELGQVLILPIQLVEYHSSIQRGPIIGWINHHEILNSANPQSWKAVVDRLSEPIPNLSKGLVAQTQEDSILKTYKYRRVTMTENLAHYYKAHFPHLCRFYEETSIPVLLEPYWLPRNPFPVTELDSCLKFDFSETPIPNMDSELFDLLRAKDYGKTLFNGLTYRLMKIEGTVYEFSVGRYFDFIKTCESLGYEAAKEWQSISGLNPGNFSKCTLPFRESTHPTDFASRSTAFGTCTLVVVKRRGREPIFLLNQRSRTLAETPGLKHVIPAGTFQPHGISERQIKQQCSFSMNIFRELIEELISDEGVRYHSQSESDFPDSLTQRGRRFFADTYQSGAFELFYLGTVIDPFNLKPEILTVGIFEEDSSGLLDAIQTSWETDESIAIEAFTEKRLDELMSAYDFVPTGRAHLHLAKRHFGFLSSRVMS